MNTSRTPEEGAQSPNRPNGLNIIIVMLMLMMMLMLLMMLLLLLMMMLMMMVMLMLMIMMMMIILWNSCIKKTIHSWGCPLVTYTAWGVRSDQLRYKWFVHILSMPCRRRLLVYGNAQTGHECIAKLIKLLKSQQRFWHA